MDLDCRLPCNCAIKELKCRLGVNIIQDGCGCCNMCARQQGELCNRKFRCDDRKGLYCDGSEDGQGVCKSKTSRPCYVKGIMYEDGEQFKPDCSRLCTCQNGQYGCISLCPQEEKRPSLTSCSNPRLMIINGRCCREWTCDTGKQQNDYAPTYDFAQNLVLQSPLTASPIVVTSRPPCKIQTTKWSPCSVTCGAGMSVRMTNDNYVCKPVQQTRLCYLRPCGVEVHTEGRDKCTPTTKSRDKHRILYQDCRSVKKRTLKFCTTCKKNRCCYPAKVKTVMLEFECSGGRREFFSFMWIKKCQCSKKCYANA
ncbi:CCN family member 1-like [Liolophura sinensis]|uniref:CCN family member 1-like n=1 Tax=Liolophura sinensis TaxID=3198878 RepID=UPI0031585A91